MDSSYLGNLPGSWHPRSSSPTRRSATEIFQSCEILKYLVKSHLVTVGQSMIHSKSCFVQPTGNNHHFAQPTIMTRISDYSTHSQGHYKPYYNHKMYAINPKTHQICWKYLDCNLTPPSVHQLAPIEPHSAESFCPVLIKCHQSHGATQVPSKSSADLGSLRPAPALFWAEIMKKLDLF